MYKVSVIGCGGIAQVHGAVLTALDGVQLTACCDIVPEKAAAFAEKFRCTPYTDFEELLEKEKPDAVHLCTPHYLHTPMAVKAAEMGIHVFTEKPPVISREEWDFLQKAAEKVRIGICVQNRYNPNVQKALEMLSSGAMGAVKGGRACVFWDRGADYYASGDWRGKWKTEGGGALINQSIHTLDLMIQLGGPVARVKGTVSTDRLADAIEVEDNAHAVLDFASGARGLIYTTNNYTCDAPVMVECVFENATWQMIGDKLFRVEDGVPVLHLDGAIAATVADKAYWGAGHAAQIAHYYDCLARGEKFPIDGRSAYPALELVKGIYTSSDEKRWVEMQG